MSTHTSVHRRKPQVTYRSPPIFTVPIVGPSPPYFLRLPRRDPSTSAARDAPLPQPGTSASSATSQLPKVKRRRLAHNAPLSLYHPLGPYAQSLPPLDPTLFGFPADVTIDEEVLPTAAAVAPNDTSPDHLPPVPVEKVTQPARKKRGGKRKRKKLEEEDRTYIAAAKVMRTRSRTPLNQRVASPDTYEDTPTVQPEEDIEMAPPTPKHLEPEPEPEPIQRAPSPLRVVVALTAEPAPSPPRQPSPIPAPRIIQIQQQRTLPPPPPIPLARKIQDVKEEGEISEDE